MFCSSQVGKISSNPGKVNFEGLVHLLRYITYKNNLGLRYYAKIEDAPLSDLFRQASIKTETQSMVLSDSRCYDCLDTGRIIGAYIYFLSRWTN